jgi:hypothetical protein
MHKTSKKTHAAGHKKHMQLDITGHMKLDKNNIKFAS